MTTSADDPFAGLNVEPVSTVDRVAEELRRALFEGELEPGTALREVALADALGVARSTVREALTTLAGEGLVVRQPNKGTTVRALDRASIVDVCRAREVIETAGVRNWRDAGDDPRDAVRGALTTFTQLAQGRPSHAAVTAAHLDVHRALAALTTSARLVATADGLYAEVRLALAGLDRTRGNLAEQVHAHAALVRLLERGRLDEAEAELHAHLRGAEESMLAALGHG